MPVAHYDASVAYDQKVKRGVPGQVARVFHPTTDLPLDDLLDLDGNPIAALVSNSQGFVEPFEIIDGPAHVKMSVGPIRYYLVDLNLVGESGEAARQAALDAKRAADLVGAPADEVVKTLIEGDTLSQGAGDARWVTNANADLLVSGLISGQDSETSGAFDEAAGQLLGSEGSAFQGAADSRYAKRGELFVNVRDFGAVGDGITNDTPAFIAAMEAARGKSAFGGCTVTALPAGDFNFGSLVRIYSHTTVDLNFSKVRRTAGSGYIMFCAYSGGPAGYGSGGTDITLRKIRFQGNFATGRGCANVFHHVDRLTFDQVTYTEALGTSGHPADIMGCRFVRMSDCAGYGRYEVAGRAYVETFQIDHSARSNAGSELPEASTAWDGLPCYDVVMERCKTEPITIGGTTYLAPRLIGSHSRLANVLHDRITLRDISVTNTGPTGSDGNYRGGVHFTHTKGLTIDGYVFINTRAEASAALGIESVDTTYPLSSVASSSPVADTAAGSVACQDVVVKNFRAYGANLELASSLILVAGKSAASVRNVSIEGQAFGFHSGNTAALDQGATIVDMNRADNVTINIKGEKVSRLVNVTNSGQVTVEMQGKDIMHSAIRASSVEILNLPKATLMETVVGAYLTGVSILNIASQLMRTKNVPTPPYTGAYNITGCTNVKASGNTGIRAAGGGVNTFMTFYGSTTNATAENTQGTGFVNVVSINADSTVKEVGTQTYA